MSLACVALAITVVLPQPSDSAPTLASRTAPAGGFSPQVLGTDFTLPSPSPDPAESSQLAPPSVQIQLITSTITALSTVLISGKPVVQTAFATTTATARVTETALVTLPPKVGPTVTKTKFSTATPATSTVTDIRQVTATETQTQTQTQTATVTATKTVTAAPVTQTVTAPGPTVTQTQISPGPTVTVTCTASPLTLVC